MIMNLKALPRRIINGGRTIPKAYYNRIQQCILPAFQRSLFSTVLSDDTTTTTSSSGNKYGRYEEEYVLSINNRDKFWSKAASDLTWFQKPTITVEHDMVKGPNNFYKWFPDGYLNTTYNQLDVHVAEGRGSQDAILYDSPLTNSKQRLTYDDLYDRVSTLAGGLASLGLTKDDRAVIYMPMIPEAVIAILACARIGITYTVVFGGFAAPELATRITDCQPKVVLSASAGVLPGNRIVPYKPLLDKALELANHNVEHNIIVQRRNVQETPLKSPRDIDYDDLMETALPVDAVPLPATHPQYILYTSGTTGLPKGVVHDTGGSAVSWKWSMGAFFDTHPGDVFWTASDIGWTVGHGYTVHAPLLQGSTTILYEGKPVGTPDAGAFWRVIDEYNCKVLFTAPTAFRAIRQADSDAKLVDQYDLSSMKTLFLAGEHSDPDTLHWCEDVAMGKYNIPAIDHWWQTELGFPGCGNSTGLGRLPTKYGACSKPVPGYDIHILDDNGVTVAEPNTLGNMVLKQPLPPGSLTTLYNNDERYVDTYLSKFPGYYDTGDAAYMDEDGYIYIMGRTDDIINVAGHRLSTGAMEEILISHPDVAECAVIPLKDELKGEVPIGFVITNSGSTIDEEQLQVDLVNLVRETIGPIACFHKMAVVTSLPKTRSGKILRSTMAKIANGEEYKVTPTIEDAKVFDYLEPIISTLVAKSP